MEMVVIKLHAFTDYCMSWAFGVAEKIYIKRAAFWPAADAVLTSVFHIPKMLKDGIINIKGMVSFTWSIYCMSRYHIRESS